MSINRILEIFSDISAVPRGSGNTGKIAEFCVAFAEKNSLKYLRDASDNIIIFKNGTKGYENSDPVILQGHLDMVCQKEPSCKINFETDKITLLRDGDLLSAKGTTLGADNGIAVAMIMAILESDNIPHPPIEAVFTSDEEIGMIGALALDMSLLKSKKMINLDGEEADTVIVSCAGGRDVVLKTPVIREKAEGYIAEIDIKGLKGGHSGVEINSGRVNANILAGRFLNHISSPFEIISLNGGDKSNAIPNSCEIKLCIEQKEEFLKEAKNYLETIKLEISDREPDFSPEITISDKSECLVLKKDLKEKLIYIMATTFNGVIDFSVTIKGLVETSLNFGILKTDENELEIVFSLRSNKETAMEALTERLVTFLSYLSDNIKVSGYYPPWEYNRNSKLQEQYKEIYKRKFKEYPKIEAIHAGLECGVFASSIENLDCIAIGPNMWEVHTFNEKLSISSTEMIFELLCEILNENK